MKTITLTDDAYELLRGWKEAKGDSFSQVVLRMVPKRGTLASLAEAIDGLPPLTDEQADALEKTITEANQWSAHRDPWTT